jgi:selenoprotein W-related protein
VAAEIESSGAGPVELVAGSGGIFDVVVDGELVYSKAKTGRFPEDGELRRLLAGAK